MKCDICGADPMTANCNNANCDTGKPRKCRNCDATAPDWSGNGLCIICARDEVVDPVSDMFEEMGIKVVDATPKTESAMTLDQAINKFRDYAQGKGDFDELDLKEVIVDNREEAVREARIDELSNVWPTMYYDVCTNYRIDGKEYTTVDARIAMLKEANQ